MWFCLLFCNLWEQDSYWKSILSTMERPILELVQISIGIFMHPAQKLCVAEQVCCVCVYVCWTHPHLTLKPLKDFIIKQLTS